MKIFEIKLLVYGAEKPEKKQFLVECETFARAEEMAYEVAESMGFKEFLVDDVVKKGIKEVHKELDPDQTMWLVKYEFGLEAKPTKTNILVSGKYMADAHNTAHTFLDPLCDSLFITAISKTEFMDYVKDEKKSLEEQFGELMEKLDQQGTKVSMTVSSGNESFSL
jgi:hypothetical protein